MVVCSLRSWSSPRPRLGGSGSREVPHPILGVVTSLTAHRYNFYWLHHSQGATRPVICSSKNVQANVAWRFIADWLHMAVSSDHYTMENDRVAARQEYRQSLRLLKDGIKGSVAARR